MPGKRYTAEQIVAKLREAEKLQGQGLTIPAASKRLGVSEQTFYRWRTKYGALKEDEAHRLKALEAENSVEADRRKAGVGHFNVEGLGSAESSWVSRRLWCVPASWSQVFGLWASAPKGGAVGRRGYSPEFRRKVLDLIASGKSIAETATVLGISDQTIYSWRRQDHVDRGLDVLTSEVGQASDGRDSPDRGGLLSVQLTLVVWNL